MARKRNAPTEQSLFGMIKSWMESAAVIGAVQIAALAVGVLGLGWSIFTYVFSGPAQADVRRQPGEATTIEVSVRGDDLRQIQKLHAAVDDVAKYPPDHPKFKEAEIEIDSFMIAREGILKRYELVDVYRGFFKRLEEFGSTPTLSNRLLLREEARKFGAALDATVQRMLRAARQ